VAASALSAVMMTAVRRVHWRNGPWATNAGYEYPLLLLATLFALTERGPGRLSLDARRRRERRGMRWALAELAGGALASQAAIAVGRTRQAAPPPAAEAPQFGAATDRLRKAA
jgi:putative oxidoreductase